MKVLRSLVVEVTFESTSNSIIKSNDYAESFKEFLGELYDGALVTVISAVLILAVMLGGCANHTVVTALPPGVTQTQVNAWTTAVNDLKTISDATHAIQVGVITANRNGLFPDGNAYAATVTAIGRADALELQATQFLQSVPNNFGQPIQTQLMNFTTQIISQLQSASGQLGIPANIATQIAAIIATGLQLEQLIQSLTASAHTECLLSVGCELNIEGAR